MNKPSGRRLYGGQAPYFEGCATYGATRAAKILVPEIYGPLSKIMNFYSLALHGVCRHRFSGRKRAILRPDRGRDMQNPGYGLPRILLRNCLKKATGRLDRTSLVAPNGEKELLRSVLPTRGSPVWDLSGLFRQSQS